MEKMRKVTNLRARFQQNGQNLSC